MAIRNIELGGTDWSDGETLFAVDLNDTFDSATNKVLTTTAFWLNDELYDVFEDFSSYTVGNAVASENPTDWAFSHTAFGDTSSGGESNGSFLVTATTLAEGTSPEGTMVVSSTQFRDGVSVATLSNLDANKHVYMRLTIDNSSTADAASTTRSEISYDGTTYYTLTSTSGLSPLIRRTYQILIIAKGSDVYDIYANQKKIASDVTIATPSFKMRAYAYGNGGGSNPIVKMYLDDIRTSKGSSS